jgi:hypothetical protein
MKNLCSIFCVLVLQFNVFAGAGIWEYFINTNFANNGNYNMGTAFGGQLASNINLNTSSLFIDLSGIKSFQDGGDNILSAAINYRVYLQNTTPGSWSSQNLPQFGGQVGNNKEWQNNTNIDLLEGLSDVGTYVVEVYFTAQGSWSGGSFELTNPSPGNFYAASFEVTTALPVSFQNFDVTELNNNIFLNWEVSQETNHSHYEIERSENCQDWTTLGKVSDNLSRSSKKYYEFVDHFPVNGRNYYRIKQVDVDGIFDYSEIRFINLNHEENKLLVFPNPSFDKFIKIEYASSINPAHKLSIHNLTGQKIQEKNLDSDQVNEHINFSDKNPGIYLISIINSQGSTLQSQKVIIH